MTTPKSKVEVRLEKLRYATFQFSERPANYSCNNRVIDTLG